MQSIEKGCEHAPPNKKVYANQAFGIHATGGSTLVRALWVSHRSAGATCRAMLMQAAARRWNVDPTSCSTAGGVVTDRSQCAGEEGSNVSALAWFMGLRRGTRALLVSMFVSALLRETRN